MRCVTLGTSMVTVLLIAVLSIGCATEAQEMSKPPFPRRLKVQPLPDGMKWINTAGPVELSDLRGKFVLLDFWTYCCINCMHVIPDLKRLEEKYPELVVIGVHSAKFHNEQVRDNIRHSVLRYEIEHPVVIDNDFALWSAYGIRAWPSFALIDPVGNVAGKASGEGPYDMFDDAIASLSAAFGDQVDREPFSMDLVRDREPGAALSYPGKIEVDQAGGRLFLSDSNHNRIIVFKPDGEITEVIGSGTVGAEDGDLENASFFRPQGMAYYLRDDMLYVADTENHLVRQVDLKARTVTTILGKGYQGGYASKGSGTDLGLNSPWDLTIMGEHLYIAMAGPHQIWRMDLGTHEAELYAGSGREDIVDGPRERAALAQPSGIDNDGERIFFADSEVSAVRMVADDQVSTLVGAGLFEFDDIDGPLDQARLQHPIGVMHHMGNLYVADTYNHKVKIIELESGKVSTLAGTGRSGEDDGPSLEATLSEPNDVALLNGNLYIVDTNNHTIRLLEPASDRLYTFLFTNEEVLYPRSPQGLRGREVILPPVTVVPGRAAVHLKLAPPPGFAWNTEAPNHLSFHGEDGIQVSDFEPKDWDWDFRIPVEVSGDATARLRIEAVAYYCEEDDPDFCRFSALDLILPVTASVDGDTIVPAAYRLEIE